MDRLSQSDACSWALQSDIELDYHNQEWGLPILDDQTLFEFICLEGAQAGLSWRTVLAKRQGYRDAFLDFDIQKLAAIDEPDIEHILAHHNIVKNKLKIKSVYSNARAAIALQQEYGSLAKAIWQFVEYSPKQNQITYFSQVPVNSPESIAMCKFLKKKGFKFVGETICYAFMQAVGMVNDHIISCPCHQKCETQAKHVDAFFLEK